MTSGDIVGVIAVFKGVTEALVSTDYQYRRGVGFSSDPMSVIDSVLYSGAQSSTYNAANFLLNYLIFSIKSEHMFLYNNSLLPMVNALK